MVLLGASKSLIPAATISDKNITYEKSFQKFNLIMFFSLRKGLRSKR